MADRVSGNELCFVGKRIVHISRSIGQIVTNAVNVGEGIVSSTVTAPEATEPENLPALVVTFGTTARKRRILEKPTSLLGRGKGCDIRLDAVEISTVHCVITHTACGLAIRDCDSRVGTLVNDQPVKEGTLSHGDILQLGPFSFRVHIPKGWPPTLPALMRSGDSQELSGSQELGSNTALGPEQLADVAARIFAVEERERELNQAKLELEKQQANLEQEKRELHSQRNADFDHIAEFKAEIQSLRLSVQQQTQLREEAEAARARLDAEHEALMYPLREENQSIQARLNQAYAELDQLRSGVMPAEGDIPDGELASEVTALREQLTESQRLIEQLRGELAAVPVPTADDDRVAGIQAQLDQFAAENQQLREVLAAKADSDSNSGHEENQSLQARIRELEDSNEHLHRQLMRVSETTDLVPEAETEQLREQLQLAYGQIEHLHQQLATASESQSPASDEELQQVRDELAEVIGQNEQLRGLLAEQQSALPPAAEGTSAEMESLRTALAEAESGRIQLQQRLEAEHEDHERRLAALRQELERERQQVKQLVQEAAQQFTSTQSELNDLRAQAAASSGTMKNMQQGVPAEYVAQLEREVQSLRAIAVDLETQLQNSGPAVPAELADYENQLNEFRLQLEEAQASLQQQELEIQEKIRQTELQVSRERAEIGRERVSLERIRAEVRTELEHAEREAKNLERMAGVHKLAHEVRGPQKAAEETNNSLSGRIRGFLKRMGE